LQYWFLTVVVFVLAGCVSGSLNPPAVAPPTGPAQGVEAVVSTPPPVDPTIAADTPTPDPALENGQPLAARVNGEPIFLDAFEQRVAQFAAQPQAAAQVLAALVDQKIIEQQARARAIEIPDAELNAAAQKIIESGTETQLKSWLARSGLTESEFLAELRAQLLAQRLFNAVTQDVPTSAEQIRLQVLGTTNRTNADALAARLAQNVDFDTLVQEIQNGSSEANSRLLDWFPRGTAELPARVEEAAFKLQPGQISGPISAAGGYYIIKLEGKEFGRKLSDEHLQTLKIQAFTRWLQAQRAAATIQQFVTLP